MTTPLASLQKAREESVAAVLMQKRKAAETAETLSGLLSRLLVHYSAASKLRQSIALAAELSGEDRDAELHRSGQRALALLEAMAQTSDLIGKTVRIFQNWSAGLDQCEAELLAAVDAAPDLARPRLGRGDAAVMRNAADPSVSEPASVREWLGVLLRTFLPPSWRMDPLVRQGMANASGRLDVRTLERNCRKLWFDRKELSLFRLELRRRAISGILLRASGCRLPLEPNSNLSPRSPLSTPAKQVSS